MKLTPSREEYFLLPSSQVRAKKGRRNPTNGMEGKGQALNDIKKWMDNSVNPTINEPLINQTFDI